MSNLNNQTCKIQCIERRIEAGLFGRGEQGFLKYVAIVAGKYIVETKEYQYYPFPKNFDRNRSYGEHIDEIAYQELLQH